MADKKKRYVLSDESLNSYKFRVLTSGIDIETRYLKNPVILYQHNDNIMSVGRMNLFVEGNELIGIPEFDIEDEIGKELNRKYEKGYMNGFSINIEPVELSEHPEYLLPGQQRMTVLKSILYEVSVANIPSNANSTVKLTNTENNEIPYLKLKQNVEMKKIALKFGLAETATEDEVLAIIESLQTSNADLEKKNTELSATITQANEMLKQAKTDKLEELLSNPKKSFTNEQKETYRKLAEVDYDNAVKLINLQPDAVKLSDFVNDGKNSVAKEDERMKLSFGELHKKHSQFLQDLKVNQPEIYKEKYKLQYGTEPKI